jgi:DNA-binding transcriptional ArsR family regulator
LYFTIKLINHSVNYEMPADQLSLTFAALAHPARRAILARLGQGEASVQELAKPFKMSAPAMSKHLKVLGRAGLISRGRDAQWRPCKLEAKTMQDASDWIEQVRAQMEGRLDRLEDYLKKLQAAPVDGLAKNPSNPKPKGE